MKRAANLSVSAELLDEAKALKISLSQTFEASLKDAVAQARANAWREENAAALRSSNDWAEANGLPLSRHRQF